MLKKGGYIYILANERNGTLYVGVTSNLIRRIYEHKTGVVDGFTKKYNIYMLIYFEEFSTIYDAITREKQLKGGSRKQKIVLIEKMNSGWKDLYEELI